MWESNLFWAIVGLVGGVITSLIFYLIDRKDRKLTYSIITTQLISNKLAQIDGLNILFNNLMVNELNSTEIIFRNEGNEVIEGNDFAKLDKLRLFTKGEFLVTNNVDSFVSESNKLSDFRLYITNASTINISFDYLPCNSSYRLNLLHSGAIKVLGTLKNGRLYESGKKSLSSNSKVVLIVILLFSLYLTDEILNFLNFHLLSLEPIYSVISGFCMVYYLAKLLNKFLGNIHIEYKGNGGNIYIHTLDNKQDIDKDEV